MVEYLKWDSDFFGKKIGKSFVDENSELLLLKSNDYDLIYVFSNNPNLNLKLIDRKVVYLISDLRELPEKDIYIDIYNKDDNYEDLLKLAIQSAQYSRFKIDPNFQNNEYEKLYKTWIDKSISKELASDIIIVKNNSNIIGFATLNKKSDYLADISLVAVDKDFRGKGIGTKVIQGAIYFAKNKGYKQLQVVTQLDNITANKLYQKSGFNQDTITYIYHIWKNDPI